MKRIAITGMGVVSPFGTSLEAFSSGLFSGKSAIRPITYFPVEGLQSGLSADVRETGFRKRLGGALARRLDPASIMTLVAARDAIDSSGLDIQKAPDEIGIAIGTRSAGLGVSIDFLTAIARDGIEHASPMLFMNTVLNAPASYLAIDRKIRGPNITLTQGMTSSTRALLTAVQLIESGRVSAVVTGGVEWIHPMSYAIMAGLGEFSSAGEFPEGARPFSETANGSVASEGAYLMVLEEMDAVRSRNGHVLAEITGYCSRKLPGNNPEASQEVIEQALGSSEHSQHSISAILSGADGTPDMDTMEGLALINLFRNGECPPVAAIRASIGSCCASGCSQILAACLALSENSLPATPGDGARITPALPLSTVSQPLQFADTILITDYDPDVFTAILISKTN